MDRGLNEYGWKLLELASITGLEIMNGRAKGNSGEQFTFVGAQGKSVVDYCLANGAACGENFALDVCEKADTDHMPLRVRIDVGVEHRRGDSESENEDEEMERKVFSRYKWMNEESDAVGNNVQRMADLFEGLVGWALNGGERELRAFPDYFSAIMSLCFGEMRVKERKRKEKKNFVKMKKKEAERVLRKAQGLRTEEAWKKYHEAKDEWKKARIKEWEESREKDNNEIAEILEEKNAAKLWNRVGGVGGYFWGD